MGKIVFFSFLGFVFRAGVAQAQAPSLPSGVNLPLPIGTIEKIDDIKRYSSGVYDLKVQYQSGPLQGQSATVSDFPNQPSLKFYHNQDDLQKDHPTDDIQNAHYAKTTRKLTPGKDPELSEDVPVNTAEPKNSASPPAVSAPPSVDVVQALDKINQGNQAVQRLQNVGSECQVCKVSEIYASDTSSVNSPAPALDAAAASMSEGLGAPLPGENHSTSRPSMCGTQPGNYDLCLLEGDTKPDQIQFFNGTTDKNNDHVGREWTFTFEKQMRQDLAMIVHDSTADGSDSHSHEMYMMVFPRKNLPSVRIQGDQQIVTLPTGETVTYDVHSKKIISGVLKENPVINGKVGVSYHGSGVSIRVDGRGGDPLLGAGPAVISKNGKSCTVPLKALWPDRSQSSADHFKFSSDEAFDHFLRTQTKCGFGVF